MSSPPGSFPLCPRTRLPEISSSSPSSVEIGKVNGVRLRESVVDDVLFEFQFSLVIAGNGFPPVQAVVMSLAPNQIIEPIAIEVFDEHWATGV